MLLRLDLGYSSWWCSYVEQYVRRVSRRDLQNMYAVRLRLAGPLIEFENSAFTRAGFSAMCCLHPDWTCRHGGGSAETLHPFPKVTSAETCHRQVGFLALR
ncbi:unnamed protein product [Hapterophycus canaliculatus]